MSFVKKSEPSVAIQAIGEVILGSGLSTERARKITGRVRQFQCTATLANDRGEVADARNLFELLILGAGPGSSVTIRCVGSDARVAYETIAGILAGHQAAAM